MESINFTVTKRPHVSIIAIKRFPERWEIRTKITIRRWKYIALITKWRAKYWPFMKFDVWFSKVMPSIENGPQSAVFNGSCARFSSAWENTFEIIYSWILVPDKKGNLTKCICVHVRVSVDASAAKTLICVSFLEPVRITFHFERCSKYTWDICGL